MYYGLFACKADVCSEFQIDDFSGTVIFAAYEYEDYSGEATVIFCDQGKFWLVQAYHCSCYGLEGNFQPEEIDAKTLIHMIREGAGILSRYRNFLDEAILALDRLGLAHASEDEIDVITRLVFM